MFAVLTLISSKVALEYESQISSSMPVALG